MRTLIYLLLGTLIGILVGCCANPQMEIAAIGGPGWRVTDAELLSVESRDAILTPLHAVVEECLDTVKPIGTLDLYITSAIVFQLRPGRWGKASGMWLGQHRVYNGRERIYINNGMFPWETAETFRHELIHFVTELEHPTVDSLIAKCETPTLEDIVTLIRTNAFYFELPSILE